MNALNDRASENRLWRGTALLPTTSRWHVWRRPSATAARLILDCYIRSGWVLVEVALVLLLLAAFFFPYFGDVAYLYGTGGLGLCAIAVVGTTVIVRTSVGPQTALILARVTWRGSYSTGLIVASAIWRIPIYLLLLGIVLASHHVIHPTLGSILRGTLGLLPNCMVLAALTVALSAPIAIRRIVIAFLIWLVIAIWPSADLTTLPTSVASVITTIITVAHLPLWPFLTCYTLSTTGVLGWSEVAAFCANLLYIGGLSWLAARWLGQRDLLVM